MERLPSLLKAIIERIKGLKLNRTDLDRISAFPNLRLLFYCRRITKLYETGWDVAEISLDN